MYQIVSYLRTFFNAFKNGIRLSADVKFKRRTGAQSQRISFILGGTKCCNGRRGAGGGCEQSELMKKKSQGVGVGDR